MTTGRGGGSLCRGEASFGAEVRRRSAQKKEGGKEERRRFLADHPRRPSVSMLAAVSGYLAHIPPDRKQRLHLLLLQAALL